MSEVMDISSKDRMEDLQRITKTILCLQRIGHDKVLIITFTRNNVAVPIRREADETEIQRANRKYKFVRIAILLNKAASIENYMMLLKCFQDLNLEGNIAIDK